jgi:hypothetical protein
MTKPRKPVGIARASYELVLFELDEVHARLDYLCEQDELAFLVWSVREQLKTAVGLLRAYDPDVERFARWRAGKKIAHG